MFKNVKKTEINSWKMNEMESKFGVAVLKI